MDSSVVGGPLQRSALLTTDGKRHLYLTPDEELFWLIINGEIATGIAFLEGPDNEKPFHSHPYDLPEDKRKELVAFIVPGISIAAAFEPYFKPEITPHFGLKAKDERGELRSYLVPHYVPIENNQALRRYAALNVERDEKESVRRVDFVSFDGN